jgi:putative membrane protein
MDKLVFLPAIIHIYIFILESFLWDRPRTRRVFGLSSDEARVTRLFAWNQGFYNLLLALAIIVGWFMRHGILSFNNAESAGMALMIYGLVSIAVAGIVLYVSASRLWRSALIQIIPALIGGIALTL